MVFPTCSRESCEIFTEPSDSRRKVYCSKVYDEFLFPSAQVGKNSEFLEPVRIQSVLWLISKGAERFHASIFVIPDENYDLISISRESFLKQSNKDCLCLYQLTKGIFEQNKNS